MRKKIERKNKGIASIFGSILILVLVLTIASALFLSLYRYEEKAQESISVEEQRVQEKIVLLSLATENVSGCEYVKAILVNNTGTITTRIRALYIDNSFICDPANAALNTNDTYVNPKDSRWIQIPDNIEYEPFSKIELVTERGIRSVEYEWKLKSGSQAQPPPETQRFNFGPLLLDFEKFYYTENYGSPPISWKPGWSVEKGATVVWNVTVTNIDDRDLTINKYCAFTMVSNDGGVQKPWFIEPPNGIDTLFIQSNSTVHLIYIWDRPRMTQGVNSQQVYMQNDRSKVFLTFFGVFHEHDGSTKPYGQTIPFEAILVRDPQMVMTANPTVIAAGSQMRSIITVTVRDVTGILVPNAQVSFTTSLGTLSSATVYTNTNGIATVTLNPENSPGTAIVIASWQGVSKSISVTISLGALSLAAAPSTLAANSTMLSTITARVTLNGNPISGETVSFSATPALGTLSALTGVTNAQGYATVAFTPGKYIGVATIYASWGTVSRTTSIAISSGIITVSANPLILGAGSTMTSTITARVTLNGNPLSGETVTFTSFLGTLSRSTVTTDSQGYATTVFTPGTNPGIATINATWGGQTQSTHITIATVDLSITPNPQIIAAGSSLNSTIITSLKLNGNPLSNALLSFATNLGTLSSSTATTNFTGQAKITLLPGATAGDATVTVTWQAVSRSTTIVIAQGSVYVQANPTTLIANSTDTTQITATVSLNGIPVTDAQVTFATTLGSLSADFGITDALGTATVTLSPVLMPGQIPGTAEVSATWQNITGISYVTITTGG